jgi:hypothetical protein
VSFAHGASSTWQKSVGVSFTYTLKRTGQTNPSLNTPEGMLRRVRVAYWKDAWNVLEVRHEDMVFTK